MTPWLIGIIAVLVVRNLHLISKLHDAKLDKEFLEAKIEVADMRIKQIVHKQKRSE